MIRTPPATRALSVSSRELVFKKFRLEVIEGPDAGEEAVSTGQELTIGTERGNHLVLTDPAVSRHQCAIRATEEGLLLVDLGSTNGTGIGGFRVEAAYLTAGAAISVGETVVRFEVLDDEVREQLSADDRFGPMLGTSPAMRRVFVLLERIARTDSTVLVEGETGTGKELAAEAIRDASPRAKRPFVVVDCGAIPGSLIESELFGHVRGAFTDAREDRAGAFEAADGGTLFLDEIGELPLDMQPKLLRVLEKGTVKRVGSDRPIEVDVRIVAATNRDLRAEVNRHNFRADLFYRLDVFHVRIPPLRERPEDIALLVAHFYRQFSDEVDGQPPPELIAELSRHSWPGNVRELRAAVQRAVLFGDARWRGLIGSAAGAADPRESAGPPLEVDFDVPFRVAKERAIGRWEKAYVTGLVEKNLGNLSRAARQVRMDRNHLRELLRKHQIPKPGDD